ncbi:MAG TPA: helix-turn-helix domain-containing protein [Jatrophihabitantaceae bacterium]
MTDRATFDRPAFIAAVDAVRTERGLLWRDVARATGVNGSTFTRLRQGRAPDVDTLAAIVGWAGLRVDDFICRTRGEPGPAPLAVQVLAFRRDPALSATSARVLERVTLAAYGVLRDGGPT